VADSQTNLAWETLFDLSATRPGPLHRRLAEAIRATIRGGRLPLGAALPPSRVLAADLKVSRWTVTQAYGQLITEGFLSGKTGSATRVSWSPEPDERRAYPRPPRAHAHGPARYDLSQCTPDYRGFPRRKWVESIRIAAETAPYDRLGYPAPALNQIALAHFLESGAYDRHLRASRQRFRSRRDILLAELARRLPAARVTGQQSGLHFLLRLPEGLAAGPIMAAAARRGMGLCELDPMYLRAIADEGLLQVGYGNLSDSLAAEAAGLLVELILASA
jgi:DNA-binding transcriptional MocR family regulator